MSARPDGEQHDAIYRSFINPSPRSRPTTLFWWSGSDLTKDRLEYELDLLAEKGIGGTVVGYTQHPNNDLDHGDPEPLSEDWWALFSWFADASAARDMTVGFQDYGIIGPVLRTVGQTTTGLHAGSLRNEHSYLTGPVDYRLDIGESEFLFARGWKTGHPGEIDIPTSPEVQNRQIVWRIPEGTWEISVVLRDQGVIGIERSSFDPMHPHSGAGVIENFYETFASHLGDRLGRSFTTFFQDELDLGLVMPMWNDTVASELSENHHFDIAEWIHGLWHDLGPRTLEFRAAYRDTVVRLLEEHYFRPIYEWHESHGTQLVMDQLSRGDLRLGQKHYGDFMDTMRWYHGPGNDDPDLTGPRNIVAFTISASIAHLNERPRVMNEAFHSSGWGVTPADIIAGANIGFASGVNQLILHGLNYTTDGGWWEWASPDFHFRQPWWRHSTPMWKYFSRVSEVLRMGHAVNDVAVLDPTQDIALGGDGIDSPETAHSIIERLVLAGLGPDVVPSSYFGSASVVDGQLEIGACRYRAVVVPGVTTIRSEVLEKLLELSDRGGVVFVTGDLPVASETGTIPGSRLGGWHRHDEPGELIAALRAAITADFCSEAPGVIYAHRSSGDFELYFIVNSGLARADGSISVRASGRAEWWDAWTGSISVASTTSDGLMTRVALSLEAGESAILCVRTDQSSSSIDRDDQEPAFSAEPRVVELTGPWTVELEPTLDNRFGDFADDGRPVGVETWHLETATTPDGPWLPLRVEDRVQFLALGPVAHEDAAEVELLLRSRDESQAGTPVRVGDRQLKWRPYSFSERTGVVQDPLLLDRFTGPHGLKGVPDEFLDPSVLDADAPAGSHYFFVSRVIPTAKHSTLAVGGRCRYRVLVDGELIAENAEELTAAFYPPWGLRDLTVTTREFELATDGRPVTIIMSVVVSADQPTRAFTVVGPAPFPTRRRRSRLRWWDSTDPAYRFTPVEQNSAATWMRVTPPPGATEMSIESDGRVLQIIASTKINHSAVPVIRSSVDSERERQVFDVRAGDDQEPQIIRFALGASDETPGPGSLTGPITWTTSVGNATPKRWAEAGLSDFSGVAHYATDFDGSELVGTASTLVLEGLLGTCRVWLNGAEVATALLPPVEVELGRFIHAGVNHLELEVANSLVNYYSRWPSPFALMQPSDGGLVRAALVVVPRQSASR